jgi:DNA polymerase IV
MNDEDRPLTIRSYPQAIMHFDGDAFFAAVETAVHPELRGKPLVTGQERGIIACANYPAKALGIKRGVALHEARRICPELVVLPSDYETYSLFSKRMFDIARKFTPVVEEYSIDEGFADLAGLRRLHRMSYEDIARAIQREIKSQLDLSVSVGLSLSKGLAKIASDFRKPQGFTAVPGRHIHLLLQRTPLADVWGFGANTVAMLGKFGLRTAYDFVSQTESWAKARLGKVGVDIWRELRGESVHPVRTTADPPRLSISKTKTFSPCSCDRDYVRARLVRNAESAFIKLRRHQLRSKSLSVFLRRQDYGASAAEARLNRPTAAIVEALPAIEQLFDSLFRAGVEYRATGIVLGQLASEGARQYELFSDNLRIEKLEQISQAIDLVNARYGKHKINTGSALYLRETPGGERNRPAWRKRELLDGESERKRLYLPRLDIVDRDI